MADTKIEITITAAADAFVQSLNTAIAAVKSLDGAAGKAASGD